LLKLFRIMQSERKARRLSFLGSRRIHFKKTFFLMVYLREKNLDFKTACLSMWYFSKEISSLP